MSRWIRVFLALIALAHLGMAYAQEKDAAGTAELKKSITAIEKKLVEIQKSVATPKDSGEELKKLESLIKDSATKAGEKISAQELKITELAKTAGEAGKTAAAAKATAEDLKASKSASDIPAKIEALKKELEKASADATKATGDVDGKAANALKAGDTAWMLVSSAFVMLMVPGLALFYGGMVRKKNVLAAIMQSFAITCLVTIIWMVVGYSLAFRGGGSFKDRKSTRLNSSHVSESRMPSSA